MKSKARLLLAVILANGCVSPRHEKLADSADDAAKSLPVTVVTLETFMIQMAEFEDLKTRLNLTPEQARAIWKIYTEQARRVTDRTMEATKSLDSRMPVVDLLYQRWTWAQIRTVMTLEQLPEYDKFRSERETVLRQMIAEDLREQAEVEVARLYSLNLGEAEQAQGLSKMTELLEAQLKRVEGGKALQFEAYTAQRDAAWKTLLSPEQFERYQKLPSKDYPGAWEYLFVVTSAIGGIAWAFEGHLP